MPDAGLTDFAARHWQRSPVVLPDWPDASGVDARRAFDAVVTASAGFRAGTRFRALPDVRFYTGEGLLLTPGDLLPAPDEHDHDRYAERLDATLDGGHLLAVREPLLLDFALWSRVRAMVAPLWRLVGQPVLPVTTDLIAAGGIAHVEESAPTATHAVLLRVIGGRLTVRLGRGGSTRRLGLVAGETAYWPATPHSVEYGARTLALRLLVPTNAGLLHDAVAGLVADTLHQRREPGDGAVPYLPYPPAQPAPGAVGAVEPLARMAAGLRALGEDPGLARALGVRWARRVSADGLEPVPPPRAPACLPDDLRVRLAAPVIRRPDGTGGWVWAVNGHAFTVRGALGDHVLDRLRRDPEPTLGGLCRTGAGGAVEPATAERASARIRALLARLYSLRGIDAVERES